MKKHFIYLAAISVLILGENAAESMEGKENGHHIQAKASFKWDKYKEMDELDLDNLFEEEFNKKNFTQAAWFLMRSVKNGNEDNKIYLSRINKDAMTFIEKEDISGMKTFVPEITNYLEERHERRTQQQTQKIVLPSPEGEEHSFGIIKDVKAH